MVDEKVGPHLSRAELEELQAEGSGRQAHTYTLPQAPDEIHDAVQGWSLSQKALVYKALLHIQRQNE
eukprot:11043506-Prorocentrum_lima.AAC.1